ncbi:MAG: flagellar hook-associated protein FlgK [Armatimonadetes bacterium]|nr:flagellar hook-associated protein FlgK [Armatimonadota bacterium]
MSTSFQGLQLSASALQARQRALEVVGHNIANVNTPGYHRQVASTQARPALRETSNESAAGAGYRVGNGVEIAAVRRIHASYLDRQMHIAQGDLGGATVRDRLFRQVESFLSEPSDQGLASHLERFFNAFEALGALPADMGARQEVVLSGQQLAEAFNRLDGTFQRLEMDTGGEVRGQVEAINDLARRIADMNRDIRRALGAGAQPNDLLDERDRYLNELAERAGAQILNQEQGDVIVSIAGLTLVQGEHAAELQVEAGPAGLEIISANTGEAVEPGGGLGALLQAANADLPARRGRLLAVRDALVAAVNAQHAAGVDGNGAPGSDFFAVVDGRLSVSEPLVADPRRVAAGLEAAPGDGRNARALAALREAALVAGQSPGAAYRALVTETGRAAQTAAERREQAEAVTEQLDGLANAESGVSLDEELTEMVSLQHAYAAAARMVTAFDEMLAVLIQQTGTIGR